MVAAAGTAETKNTDVLLRENRLSSQSPYQLWPSEFRELQRTATHVQSLEALVGVRFKLKTLNDSSFKSDGIKVLCHECGLVRVISYARPNDPTACTIPLQRALAHIAALIRGIGSCSHDEDPHEDDGHVNNLPATKVMEIALKNADDACRRVPGKPLQDCLLGILGLLNVGKVDPQTGGKRQFQEQVDLIRYIVDSVAVEAAQTQGPHDHGQVRVKVR